MGKVADAGQVSASCEGIDTLLEPKPETVQLPLEPIYEVTITGSSAQSERERLARNAQSKMNWENRCQRQLEIGIMCGDKPWAQADRKTVSMLYLSLGTEGRRIVCSQNPHLKMDSLSTAELWTIMETAFIRQRNIKFDRYVLLTTKQTRGVSIEHFFGKLKELSENCELGSLIVSSCFGNCGKFSPCSLVDDSASPGTQNILKRTHKRDRYDTGTNCEQWMAT